MKIKNIFVIIVLVVLALFLTGCSNNGNDDDLSKKVDAEIDYMDAEIIKIMSQLNNINFSTYMLETRKVDTSNNKDNTSSSNSSESQSESSTSKSESNQSNEGSQENNNSSESKSNKKINVTEMINNPLLSTDYNDIKWDEILAELEVFNTAWNTIILDLYKLNIQNVDITSFSNDFDKLLINTKNKDKTAALSSAVALYSYLPKYLESYSTSSSKKNLVETKLHILNSYVGTSANDWEYSDNELSLAEQAFSNVMKNAEYVSQKEYNINRVYIALKELQNSNQYRDVNISFLKFRNFIQEIEVL